MEEELSFRTSESDISILNEKDKKVQERELMRIMEKWFKNRESGQSKKNSREEEDRRSRKRYREEDHRRYHRSHSRYYKEDRSSNRGKHSRKSSYEKGKRIHKNWIYFRDLEKE